MPKLSYVGILITAWPLYGTGGKNEPKSCSKVLFLKVALSTLQLNGESQSQSLMPEASQKENYGRNWAISGNNTYMYTCRAPSCNLYIKPRIMIRGEVGK